MITQDRAAEIVQNTDIKQDKYDLFEAFVDLFELSPYEIKEFAEQCDFIVTERIINAD